MVEFGGTERFVLEGRLGEGGMGVVYRAVDRDSMLPVALKTMSRVEPSALLRFKNEFRALADLSHPNLVQLYELVSAGGHWFFTMELLDGVDFMSWLHAGEPAQAERGRAPTWIEHPTEPDSELATCTARPAAGGDRALSGVQALAATSSPARLCDVARLRPALRQLVQGVLAIHAAGKLHRDIKPSNVMVTREGRVVLLDFGVVGDLRDTGSAPRFEDQVMGTPAYMAPEQARGAPPGTAADWYAIGVMLYEALTGHLPFNGSPHDVLFNKQGTCATPPRERVAGVPGDLDALCMDLLLSDAKRRPRGDEVLRRLSLGEGGRDSRPSPAQLTNPTRAFVGRKAELEALHRALPTSDTQSPEVVLLAGRSGMGKTILAQRFLQEVARDHGALVFTGRCFEREALPFKGLDSVVDELSRYLTIQPPRNLTAALPAGLHYLTRVFPVLLAVPCFAGHGPPEHEVIDPSELRKRAFAALRALLLTLGAFRPLVIHVDDAQWSDIDSLVLLEALLEPPNAPRLLLVLGFREELRESSAVLQELSRVLGRLRAGIHVREVTLAQLSIDEAVELASSSLDVRLGESSAIAQAIAREAQGVPIFVAELSEWQREQRGASDPEAEPARGVSLEQVIQSRVAELPLEGSRLLELVAVANGPLPYGVIERAAGIPRNDALRARLRAARLVRTFRSHDQEFVEAYHARVKDSVVLNLSGEQRRDHHGALALALERTGSADPEALVEHYLGAGNAEQARRHVLTAARAAEASLAFLRAARLYRVGLDIGVEKPRNELWASVGDALVAAGRSSEAAEAYTEAARTAPLDAALELQRRAAEHYFKSGHDLRGLQMLRQVLQAVGLRYPTSPSMAVSSLLYHRARLRLRGLSFRPRALASCPPRDLARVDVAFSATAGLAMVDVIRGADFAAQHLQLALEVGEPMRICRALALEAGNAAAVGAGSQGRMERLVRTAEQLSRHTQDPHGAALAKLAGGLVQVFSGQWRAARAMLDEAEKIFRERCRAVNWELTNTQAWSCNSLILCGDLPEAARRMPTLLREARDRSDRYALMHLIYPACITRLAEHDVEEAWRMASDDSTFRGFEPGRFTAGHWGRLISTQSVHRYRGEGRQARAFVQAEWRGLESSRFLRVHLMRVFSQFERALSFIAALDEDTNELDLQREAERVIRQVRGDRPGYAAPMGEYLLGCLSAVRGRLESSHAAFERAASGLEAADMGYLALCARMRSAQLAAGDSGRALAQTCLEQFHKRGIVNVTACLAMSAPGFRRLSA